MIDGRVPAESKQIGLNLPQLIGCLSLTKIPSKLVKTKWPVHFHGNGSDTKWRLKGRNLMN